MLFVVAVQLFTSIVSATPIPTISLTSTQTTTATTSCVNGFFASNWTSGTGYWLYTLNTTGYTNVSMTFNTQRSSTGPSTGVVYYNTGSGDVVVSSFTVSTSCQSKVVTFPAAVNGIANLQVKVKMSGASNAGGTHRMPSNGGFDGTSSGCTGTPAAGTASAGNTNFCPGGTSVLTLNGATVGAGIAYQWQSSPNASTWTNIAGATGVNYTTPALSATTYYRAVTTCTNSSLSATSSAATVTVIAPPAVGAITGVNTPLFVDATDLLSNSASGGIWTSSNTSVATIDAISGLVTAIKGGTTIITYQVEDAGTGCVNTATVAQDVLWPNTLALYAGLNGTNTNVIDIPGETAENLVATGFGSAAACGSGGLSGLTMPVSTTTYSAAGPRVSYKVKPDAGQALNVYRIRAVTRSSGTGPTKARIAYRIGNGAWISEGADVAQNVGGGCGASSTTWNFNPIAALNGITDSIEVGVFPYAPGASTGTFQLNSLELYGVVTTGTACSGTPATGGYSTPTVANICDSGSRWLSLDSGVFTGTAGVGIGYQWEKSVNGGAWTTIANANNIAYNTGNLVAGVDGPQIYYRVQTTCVNGGGFATSNVDTVNVTPTPSAGNMYNFTGYAGLANYLAIGNPVTLTTSGATPGGVIWWRSNDTTSTAVDSATGDAIGLLPGVSVITVLNKVNGCVGTSKDTVYAVYDATIAAYLGLGGNSTAVTNFNSNIVSVTPLAQTGYGTATPCSNGGLSGLTNNGVVSYNATGARAYFDLEVQPTHNADIDEIHATVRRSASGIQKVRLAYSLDNGATWIDNGSDLTVDFDDCGYSTTDLVFYPSPLLSLIGGDKIRFGVFGFDPAAVGGTLQVNTIDVVSYNNARPNSMAGAVIAESNVQISPNPATETLTVASIQKVNVVVVGMDGKVLINQKDAEQVDIRHLAHGLYIIKVYDQQNALISTKKFAKH